MNSLPSASADGLVVNKPTALAKTRLTIWAKAHYYS